VRELPGKGDDVRREYISQQQRQHGRKVLAVLPIHYPKELLTAMNLLAVELWGPPGKPRGPDAGRIQTYVCAVVRNALAFLASGGADVVDGVLFPHTCDSIQGLATQAPDFGGWGKQVFRFLHPKGDDRPSSRTFIRRELEVLAVELERLTHAPLEPEALGRAIDLHREIHALRARLVDRRRCLPVDDLALYTALRRGEFLWPSDHLGELREAAAVLDDTTAQQGTPVMITGLVPEPMTIFSALDEAGAFVVADDYAAVGRRIVRDYPKSAADPLDTLVDLQFAGPPCSTRTIAQQRRIDVLEQTFDRSGAAGLIIHMIKFCEPELFDVPLIRRRFEAKGVPVLYLESELERELAGQTVTRVEAFVEMLRPVQIQIGSVT
jgi:benzoyl-CoA reductase/2-hydroxyglutaryl-CoA dehydratase subunit BcrC/BadD/HgdB